MDCSTPGLPVLHYLPVLAQIHVHLVGEVIQSSHPLPPSSPFAFNLPQHQGLFQWVGSLHQVAKVLELQHQGHSFQWIFRLEFPLGLTNLISCCPRDSQQSSPTPQFRSIDSSVLSLLYGSKYIIWSLTLSESLFSLIYVGILRPTEGGGKDWKKKLV